MKNRPSPNFDARPGGRAPDMIVLHYTGMRTAEEALSRLCDPASRVSAHYFIDEDGTPTRLVPETMRAWHAGKAHWRGEEDINGCAIGIELQNPGHEFGYRAFPGAQIASLVALIKDIRGRFAIADARILGHSDVAPGRKQDPGELFPWQALAAQGIGLWPDANVNGRAPRPVEDSSPPRDIKALQEKLRRFGYCVEPAGAYDGATRKAIIAFKRHFAPVRLDDRADDATMAVLDNLLVKIGG